MRVAPDRLNPSFLMPRNPILKEAVMCQPLRCQKVISLSTLSGIQVNRKSKRKRECVREDFVLRNECSSRWCVMQNVSGTNKDLLASCWAARTHARTRSRTRLPSGRAWEAAKADLSPPACRELGLCERWPRCSSCTSTRFHAELLRELSVPFNTTHLPNWICCPTQAQQMSWSTFWFNC